MKKHGSDRVVRVHLLERGLPSGKVQLFLDIYDGKEQKQESTGILLTGERTQDKMRRRAGEQIRAERETQILAGVISGIPVERRGVPFFQFAYKIAEQKRGTTKTLYKDAIKQIESFVGPEAAKDLTFEHLSKDFCMKFANHLQDGQLKRNTAAAYFFKFKSILKDAEREGIIFASPATDITIKTIDSDPKFIYLEDLRKLAKAECGNEIVRDAFIFSCLTGMSFIDIVNLRWQQIRGARLTYARQKTKQQVSFNLDEKSMGVLERQRGRKKSDKTVTEHGSESVFKLPSRQTVDKILKRWGKRAGIGIPLSMHKGRHSFGTLLHASGTDIYTIMSLMGHRSPQMTMRYSKVMDPRKNEAVARLPWIE